MKIVKVNRCVSTEPWFEFHIQSETDTDKVYTVLIPWPDSELDDFICECLGYIHRGTCHHQDEASELLCRWDEETGPEKQTKKNVCPRCGNQTITSVEFA